MELDLVNVIAWVVFGGVAGWLASVLAGKDASFGVVGNVVVGIVGAFLGGFIMNQFGEEGVTGFNLMSMLVAVGGSVLLLFLLNMFNKR